MTDPTPHGSAADPAARAAAVMRTMADKMTELGVCVGTPFPLDGVATIYGPFPAPNRWVYTSPNGDQCLVRWAGHWESAALDDLTARWVRDDQIAQWPGQFRSIPVNLTHHDAPAPSGGKEAHPVPSNKTQRVDVRINGRIVYSQDVTEYSLTNDATNGLTLTAAPVELTKVDTVPNPLLAPTGTPIPEGFQTLEEAVAPDADLTEKEPAVPVIEAVHDGRRDRKARKDGGDD
ncbi:hypothetical protein SEA_TYPHA_127 [Mycobacterium phage Typha]|uniref:Uncharacterized protein n=1 Tax=Mycobacterium phage Typha TaxID=2517971 RepID=A0A482JDT9_9CAUD|nr:hypothetical protein KCH40_gp042 [Mycobacterium phage Typha]QBP29782.1 hypothetical protein SEA_TYPHA_127 [Mycobacterium phage Typha]